MTNDREAVALLPCPFCGGVAVVTGSIADAPKNHVVCTVCPVGTRQFMGMEAAQIWNTRTPPASEPSEAMIEAGVEEYFRECIVGNNAPGRMAAAYRAMERERVAALKAAEQGQ